MVFNATFNNISVISWRSVLLSVPITTKVVSSNPAHGEVYSIQHCYKVCQWLVACRGFSLGILVSSINKTDRHDMTEILLKVALNTINPNPIIWICNYNVYLYLYFLRAMRMTFAKHDALLYIMSLRRAIRFICPVQPTSEA
jgi:hypothetical protein